MLRIILATCALFLCSVAGCSPKPDKPQGTSATGSSAKEMDSKWIVLRDRSIAGIENKQSDDKLGTKVKEATDGFRQLCKQFPKDANCLQNLVVALTIQLKRAMQNNLQNEVESIQTELKQSIELLRKLAPEDPEPLILEARLQLESGDGSKAKDLLREAAKKPTSGADVHFQLIELLQSEDSENALKEIRLLLEEGLKRSPNNLALVANYLDVLAKLQDKSYLTHWELCKELYRPLSSRTSAPIPKLLELARDAANKEDWKVAQTQAARIRNVLLGEISYQHDLFTLRREDNLEYARIEFQQSERSTTTNRQASKVKFQPADSLPTLSGVTALTAEDIDLDGLQDLVVAKSNTIEAWNTKTFKSILTMPVESLIEGIVLVDLDRDFQRSREQMPPSALPSTAAPDAPKRTGDEFVDTDVDFVLYGPQGLMLFENIRDKESGERSLKSKPLSDGMDSLKEVKHVVSVDFDHDADLDLVVASSTGLSLWSNRGDWTFANFTAYSSLPQTDKKIESILALDLDRNVLNDFLLGDNSNSGPMMLASNLHGRYTRRDVAWPSEIQNSSVAIEVVDVNRDACWDLVSCGNDGARLTMMKSPARKSWAPSSTKLLSKTPARGVRVVDIDNDSYADCAIWGSSGIEVFMGGEDGQLVKSDGILSVSQSIRSLVFLDFDSDRDDDLVVVTDQGDVKWFVNEGGNLNNQLEIVIRADEDGKQNPRGRCNMHGIGSLIELKSDGTYQSKIVRGTRTRFGLGQKTEADIARVIWTNGIPNNILGVKSRSTVFDQQNLGGSCPYLYAWNGERFEFCTDCLWAAPIGLQFGMGVSAPTREWEYLKIDGSHLKPKGNEYQLQVTEELWEAAYFDAIQLMAIDHPKELDVFTNEKVGPAEMAQFKIFTVKDRRYPKSIQDQKGNDLRDATLRRDQRFTKTWSEGYNQGLAETHWLEIDFGDEISGASGSDQVIMYLTGWLFPTCTSLNLAMEENPLRPKLQPPSIQVPDASGKWVEVIPYAGFPGGKTKTMALDLSGKFLCHDRRIRLVTNMELCWDEIFFTVNEREPAPESYQVTPLKLLGAELSYRGFSQLIPQPGNAPKRYEYHQTTTESIWPPMTGAFTRFGDVTKLIAESDDLQVVMGAGDQMTIRFSTELRDIPAGWVRDFVIYNVGWDKDADLNTIQGQDVGPLPFRAMSKYPYEPDQQFPSTPRHVDFLKRYQTRYQNGPAFWNQIRDFQ